MGLQLKIHVKDPVYPDPETLPIPDPEYHHVLKYPKSRITKTLDSHFEVLTTSNYVVPTK